MQDEALNSPSDHHDHQPQGTAITCNELRRLCADHAIVIDESRPSTPPLSGHDETAPNGHTEHEHTNSGPPAKKRKLTDTNGADKSSPRLISPPWKRSGAEGPTSFVQDGKRRSGRTNNIPLALQPHSNKRQTRAAFDKASGDHSQKKPQYNLNQRRQSVTAPPQKKLESPAVKRAPPHSHGKAEHPSHVKKQATPKTRAKMSPTSARIADLEAQLASLQRKQRQRPKRHTNGFIKHESDDSAEHSDENVSSAERGPTPPLTLRKVNFRVHLPGVTITTPAHNPGTKRFDTFEEFLDKDDTEYVAGEDIMNPEQIHREAVIRNRVREAQLPGGLLHKGGINRALAKRDELDKHYTHHDHMLAHAAFFRKLMVEEHKAHRRKAEILAHEAKKYVEAKARKNKVKTKEELEWEETLRVRAVYKSVVKDVDKLWTAVLIEVDAMRAKEYEEQQQAENKRHLERVLDRTTQMLSREMDDSILDSADITDEEDAAESDEESDNSEDMSDSGSDSSRATEEEEADGDLTVEQLREKYGNIPEVEKDPDTAMSSRPASTAGDDEEESDPETEMDSEFDSDDSLEEGSEEEFDQGEDTGGGLLGLFFSKKELKQVEAESPAVEDDTPADEGVDTEDATGLNSSTPGTPLTKVDSPAEEVDGDEVVNELESQKPETPLIEELTSAQDPPAQADDTTNVESPEGMEVDDAESTSTPMDESLAEVTQKATGGKNASTEEVAHVDESPSSAASPHTTATKASAPESVSSVEPPHAENEAVPTQPVDKKTSDIKTPVPKLLRGTLRTYQHEGLDWLANLYANGRSGILADEMGLGKTIQSIAVLAHLAEVHEVWGPHLIVVPTSVMLNWEMEFKKFLPGFKILTYYGSIEERKAKRRGWLQPDSFNVCITSYQLVLQDQQSFKRRRWQYMILDEAHNIKNFRSERWQTMMTFNTQARLLLTGTPLQNNLTELWSLLFFLHYGQDTEGEDDAFAGLKEWSEWFKRPVESILEQNKQVLDQEDKEQVSKLHKVIRPFLLRRLKADVEKQMPLKYEHVELCRLSKRQRQLYDGFMSRAQTKETLASGNYLSIINALMQLRKVCNHPDLFETRPINTSLAMPKSVAADFEIQDLLVRRRTQKEVLDRVSLDFLQLVPICHENISHIDYHETTRRHAFHQIKALRDKQWRRVPDDKYWHGEERMSVLASLENVGRQRRLKQLDQLMYQEAYRHHAHPVYGRGLIEMLSYGTTYDKLAKLSGQKIMTRFWDREDPIEPLGLVQSLQSRAMAAEPLVQKYACLTPAVVANDMSTLAITDAGAVALRESQPVTAVDPFHEARMKLSIAFPDKRLLQYDCGKLQRLDKLLRNLQAGGHRALIFTQMTKVLDILEQFLNIHGHRYLRLDGSTKIEQRQLLTERFNNDNRILAFILSSRSGGLGINLTGADTVIFYDLDWNPAMDKQCTDRAHRIGQTRDVHIYRFVSEHTIESNILRKASQKQMLDDVVIQEGDFTTDYLTKVTYRDMLDDAAENDMAGAAMDRLLGNNERSSNVAAFEQAEEREDIVAAKVAAREVQHADDGDFEEKTAPPTEASSKAQTPGPFGAINAALEEGNIDAAEEERHIDNYMVKFQRFLLRDVPLGPSKPKKKSKNPRRDELRARRARERGGR